MVDITCPWCEEPGTLRFPELEEPAAYFSCTQCGTVIEFADEPVALDMAA